MDKIIRKIVCVTVIFALAISFNIFTSTFYAMEYADEEIEEEVLDIDADYEMVPTFTYIVSTNTDLNIIDGTACCLATVSCNSQTTNSCSATLSLQKRQTGTSTWYTLFSVTDTGTFYATAYEECNVVSGYQYRVKAKYTATGNNGSDTTYSYSRIKTVS